MNSIKKKTYAKMFGVPHNMSSSMISIISYEQRDINNTGQVFIEPTSINILLL